ncbi:MAG: protein-L-isoaspartate(D-aspartate) O-methyltransferase [Bryobacteraceae bacterium]
MMRLTISLALISSLGCAQERSQTRGGQAAFETQRERMMREHIRARGVRDRDVLEAMRETPRHLFVPEHLRDAAYYDQPLPIGHGQTISQPYIVAAMTELLEPGRDLKVLEIGTGSGYQTAILSKVFGEVYSIEIVPELAESAEAKLKELQYDNVHVRAGDGYKGWPEAAPFDRIILTAAPPELPEELVKQLAPGGILVAPVGGSASNQELVVVEKGKDGRTKTRTVFPVRFVPMVPGK